MFKQWKEKYLVLTMEGSLLVCRDAESPPDQVVALQSNCESIAEGREILDLPRLPPGGRRDCCFALILPQNKFLLLLSDNPDDCMWVPDVLCPTFYQPLSPHTGTSINWGSLLLCSTDNQTLFLLYMFVRLTQFHLCECFPAWMCVRVNNTSFLTFHSLWLKLIRKVREVSRCKVLFVLFPH